MFKDIKTDLTSKRQQEPLDGVHFSEILYADDTFIFGRYTPNINKLLWKIQDESAKYGLKLNLKKCGNLTMNQGKSSVRFKTGMIVPRAKQAEYLGTILSDTNNHKIEIDSRLAECNATANKLKIFWNKANTGSKWKLQVLDAVIRSKLLYGLETIQLTDA